MTYILQLCIYGPSILSTNETIKWLSYDDLTFDLTVTRNEPFPYWR